jgi:hypothetical protein
MSPRLVRFAVITVFVGGIAGMIVGSIADNNGIAVTFGLATAVAALCLMAMTAVAGADAFARPARFDEQTATDVEERIAALVADGCDEDELRELVRTAVRLGRDAR